MLTTTTTKLEDLFAGSFSALTPAATDIDRPRLIRHLRNTARGPRDATDPLIEHLRRDGFRESKVLAYTHRPFDTRWLYADPSADHDYLAHLNATNPFVAVSSESGAFVTRRAAIEHSDATKLFPLYHVVGRETRGTNLSAEAREFVRRNGIAESDLFHHLVAMIVGQAIVPLRTGEIGCPTSVLLQDDTVAIRNSAILGYRVATLFADENPLASHDLALRAFAVPGRVGKEARMLRGSALAVSDSWRDREHVTRRPFAPDEVDAIHHAAIDVSLPTDEAMALLGNETCDVHVNDRALLKNVPLAAWRYEHRGVPLLRAWLRDRHSAALGRPLQREEITHLSLAARRITGLLLLQPALRKNVKSF